MNKWLRYADKACERLPKLVDAENESEILVRFLPNPKINVLTSVLDQLCPKKKQKVEISSRQVIFIPVKNYKLCGDLQKFLSC
jgi:hypothetical protein